MAQYTDRAGNVRTIEIGGKQLDRAAEWDIDLYNLQALAEYANNTYSTLKLIHHLQGDPLPFNEWFSLHTSDAADDAVKAFLEALIEFYPSRLGGPLKAWMGLAETAIGKAFEIIGEMPHQVSDIFGPVRSQDQQTSPA